MKKYSLIFWFSLPLLLVATAAFILMYGSSLIFHVFSPIDNEMGALFSNYSMSLGLSVAMCNVVLCTFQDRKISLLPTSPLNKYLFAVCLALLVLVLGLFASILVEMIVRVVGIFYATKGQIAIGAFVRYLFQNPVLITIEVLAISWAFWVKALVRRMGYALMISMCVLMAFLLIQIFKPISYSFTISVCCVVLAVIFFVSGYFIYKRWQIANNGFLMI